ncbi:MAG: Cys-tRNA(Pro) deacylase [Ruminococcaceae bacterium]|nr:Cys-tRNA(Pro) deacylase [Oscillospiraceae bacterium]
MASIVKTNAMRILDQKKLAYEIYTYPHDGVAVDGVHVAELIGKDPSCVFKTLVTRGATRAFYVFVIPVSRELDLKKAARAVGEKSVAMIPVSEILATTGYIRGGCSPIGMRKQFTTTFDSSALSVPYLIVSGGKIGLQIQLTPQDLISASNGKTFDLTAETP